MKMMMMKMMKMKMMKMKMKRKMMMMMMIIIIMMMMTTTTTTTMMMMMMMMMVMMMFLYHQVLQRQSVLQQHRQHARHQATEEVYTARLRAGKCSVFDGLHFTDTSLIVEAICAFLYITQAESP